MRVFIYLRVSTDDQEDNTSLEQQEKDCRAYCATMGFTVVDAFSEVYSAATWEGREIFKAMRERYLHGEANGVVVRTYSRFTRDIAHYYILREEMKHYDITLYCVKEQYDESPMGRMMQALQMGFNEQERAATRQRTIDGKRARVENKHQYLAGKKPPYGYRFNDEKTKDKLVIHEEEAEVVRQILRMRAQRVGLFSIARYLTEENIPTPGGGSLWNERTLRIIIARARDMYVGIAHAYKYEFTKEYRDGREITVKHERPESERLLLPEGTVPRIIDDETAILAIAAAALNTQDAGRNNPNPQECLLRSGFIRCGNCGASMVKYTQPAKHNKNAFYTCYRCPGENRRTCDIHMEISVPKIDKITWDYVCSVVKDMQIIESAVNAVLEMDVFSSSEKAAQKAIAECKILVDQYRDDLKTTGLSKSARAVILEDLGNQMDLLERLEEELMAIQRGTINYKQVMQEYRNFIGWCQRFKEHDKNDATYEEKRDALRFLGVTAYIYKPDAPQGRYSISLAPPQFMDALRIVPPKTDIEGTSSRSGSHKG
ncbi:MAG TPA: recombinase family protein, partial [Mucilaginibacter sp.]|nr:recombinase family protein [Mucilaginibacter sp.]